MNLHLPFILLITLVYISQVTAPAARRRQQRPVPPALVQQRSKALAVYKRPPQAPVQRPNAYGHRQRDALPRKGTNRPRGGQGTNLPRKGPAQAPRPAPVPRPAPRPTPRPTPKRPVTKAVVPRPNYAVTKKVAPTAKPKPGINPLDVPMELRMKKKATCNPGHAVYDLYWTEPYVGFRKYHVSCLNFTTSCREKCEYSTACTRKKYGENLYVRGIWLVFDAFKNFQHYFLFLCCNTTLVPEDRRCEGKKRLKESTQLSGAVAAMTQLTFREANSTYPDDKTNFGITKTGQKIYMEACTSIKPKKSFQLCPYVQVALGQSASGSGTGTPLDPLLATGITTLVLGTIGIALRIVPDVCCCRGNQICTGLGWNGDGSGGHYGPVSVQVCLARCLGDVRCVAMEYGTSGQCDINYASDLASKVSYPPGKYCYKC